MLKISYYVFIGSFMILAQAGLFNILSRGPLVAWKQMLLSALFVIGAWNCHRMRSILERVVLIKAIYCGLWVILIGFAIIICTSFLRGISLYKISYTVFLYAGGISFVVLPIIAVSSGHTRKLFNAIMIMGLISALGLIVDYRYNAYDMVAAYLPVNQAIYRSILLEREFSFVRAQFFFESTNTIAPFMTLCMMACLITLAFKPRSVLAIVSLVVMLFGLMFVGQRGVFLLTVIFGGLSLIGIIKASKGYFVPLLLASIVGLAIVTSVAYAFQSESGIDSEVAQRYLNPFDQTETANKGRFSRWQEGLSLVYEFDPVYTVIGRGMGLTVKTLQGEGSYQTHFESSFFMTFFESGLIGLLIRYAPIILAFTVILQRSASSSIDWLLLAWLGCCLLATLTSPNIGSFHVQASMWFILGLSLVAPWIEAIMRPVEH